MIAALVLRNKVLAKGYNNYSSRQLSRKYKKHEYAVFCHAEIDAIHSFLKENSPELLQKCTLYVCRAKLVNGKWVVGNSKPCIGCQRAIDAFKIKKIIYSREKNNWTL